MEQSEQSSSALPLHACCAVCIQFCMLCKCLSHMASTAPLLPDFTLQLCALNDTDSMSAAALLPAQPVMLGTP